MVAKVLSLNSELSTNSVPFGLLDGVTSECISNLFVIEFIDSSVPKDGSSD